MTKPTRRRAFLAARKVVLRFLCGYALLVLVVFLVQRRLIYFPDTRAPSLQRLSRAGLARWPSDQSNMGLVGNSPEQAKTVVVFHGNAGTAADRSYYVRALQPLGYRVILVEFPGYGGRPGDPSETALVTAGTAAVQRAAQEAGAPVLVFAESLGCGVAAAVAADPTVPIAGLALITPWDSLPDVAQSQYWFLPARWMVRDRYDSVANLSHLRVPVAVLLAENDEVIAPAHGQRLYDRLNSPKRRWVFPGAGHNTWPREVDAPWWREVVAFLSAHPSAVGASK